MDCTDFLEETLECKGSNICCPFLHPATGDIQYLSSGTGDIYSIDGGRHNAIAFSGGTPLGAHYDREGTLYIADCAHGAVLRLDDENNANVVVKVYEEKQFKGPNSIVFDDAGTMYFSDSGPMGETTIEKPAGSVYTIGVGPDGGQILRPLALECLAHPAGICLSPKQDIIYVAEMMRNRVLRFIQRPTGVYHFSVFYQLSGGIGPSSLACDSSGRLYVGSYDIQGPGNGSITVISPSGALETTLEVPGTEITGVFVRDDKLLYVTEASTNNIYSVSLEHLLPQ